MTYRGLPTIACPEDAPPGVVGFVRGPDEEVHHASLLSMRGSTHVIVELLDTGERRRVRRESFRLQLIRA
jgi:hypothetical protein